MSLNQDQMKRVAEVFDDALTHTLRRYVPQSEAQQKVSTFILSQVLGTQIYAAFGPNRLEQFADQIFLSTEVRDFVYQLTVDFHVRLGGDQTHYAQFLQTLAWALDLNANAGSFNITPDEIRSRLVNEEYIVKVLAENKWLVTLSMASLYGTASSVAGSVTRERA